jgi:uncharacterized ferritin-like protein (DUF455 family)
MNATKLVAIAAVSAAFLAAPAQARCKREPMPTVLDAIVVTEKGSYTMAEWQARESAKRDLAARNVVTFEPLVVTPDYEITRGERREHARAKAGLTPVSAQASTAPVSPLQRTSPSLTNFLRRLFH